jgi:hypothetical protein
MSYSRISKLVFDVGTTSIDSLREAERQRAADFVIVVGDRPSSTALILARTATALALRCFGGKIVVCAPATAARVRDGVAREAAEYGASDRLRIDSDYAATSAPCIGLGARVGDAFADASGWTAFVNILSESDLPAAAPAAVFATCCAFAKVFAARVLGRPASTEAWSFFMSTLEPREHTERTSTNLDLGRIGLLGAGAIGSAFCFALMLSGWAVDLEIFDDDAYVEPNQETTFLIGLPEVLRGRRKALALAGILKDNGIAARGRVVRVDAESELLRTRRDVFACAVDNAETRRALDAVNAAALINAAVGGSAEDAGHVVCSRHLNSDLSLSSLYSGERGSDPSARRAAPSEVRDDDCSRLAYNSVSMAAPFLGGAAGALLLAQCASIKSGLTLPINYIKLDLLNLQSKMQRELKQGAPRFGV